MTPNNLQNLELTWIGKGEENNQNRRLDGLINYADEEKINEIPKSVSISDSDI